jgi:hypothetical protein
MNLIWGGKYTNAYYTLAEAASSEGTRVTERGGRFNNAGDLAEMVHLGWLETRPSGPRGGKRWHATELGLALIRYADGDLSEAERELHAAWAEEFGKAATAQEWGVALTMRAGNPDMPLAWVVVAAKVSCAA